MLCRICGRVTNGVILLTGRPIHQKCLDGIKVLLSELSEKAPILEMLGQQFVIRPVAQDAHRSDER